MSSCGWKLSAALAAGCIALVGCTTTEQANKALEARFQGKTTDSFFLAYGPPASSYKLNSGGTLYTWQERAKIYQTAGSVNSTVIGNQVYSTVSPGSTVSVQCSLKIQASPSGMIEKIDVLSDTIGDWQLSRCNEVFSKAKTK